MTTHGMTEITLTHAETGEEVTYEVADIQCAKLLAAGDHGGEAEDWLTQEELEREGDMTMTTATTSVAKANAEILNRMIQKLIAKCIAQSRNPEPQEMALIQTQAELVYESIES